MVSERSLMVCDQHKTQQGTQSKPDYGVWRPSQPLLNDTRLAAERRSSCGTYCPIKAAGPTTSFKAINIYMFCLKELGRVSKSNSICVQFGPNALKHKLQPL